NAGRRRRGMCGLARFVFFMRRNTSRRAVSRVHYCTMPRVIRSPRVGRFAHTIRLLWLAACAARSDRPLFKLLNANQTGVAFANTVTTDDSLNVLSDAYVYNGAGVAVGDIDNDGLPDLFFSGNMVSSRLYLNKGHMRFEDITQRAGVTTNRW